MPMDQVEEMEVKGEEEQENTRELGADHNEFRYYEIQIFLALILI